MEHRWKGMAGQVKEGAVRKRGERQRSQNGIISEVFKTVPSIFFPIHYSLTILSFETI
jgi:hypothetical protein